MLSRKKIWTLGLMGVVVAYGEAGLQEQPQTAGEGEILYIDRMDPVRGSKTESIFGTFDEPPSRILATRGPWGREDLDQKGYGKNGLKLKAELQPSAEDPSEAPGRAGYYTTLKKGEAYLDAARFHHLTFWIRGADGGEKLQIALADKQAQENGKRHESGSIEAFTQRGAVDKEWQRVRIPLDIFQVDTRELYQIVIFFDNSLYDSIKVRTLTVFIDDLALEKP